MVRFDQGLAPDLRRGERFSWTFRKIINLPPCVLAFERQYSASEGWRTWLSPTRSDPEGSSRNEFSVAGRFSLPPLTFQ